MNKEIDREPLYRKIEDILHTKCGETLKLNRIIRLVESQNQKDLKKLSFHLGVDIKTLEGYLKAKDEV